MLSTGEPALGDAVYGRRPHASWDVSLGRGVQSCQHTRAHHFEAYTRRSAARSSLDGGSMTSFVQYRQYRGSRYVRHLLVDEGDLIRGLWKGYCPHSWTVLMKNYADLPVHRVCAVCGLHQRRSQINPEKWQCGHVWETVSQNPFGEDIARECVSCGLGQSRHWRPSLEDWGPWLPPEKKACPEKKA